VVEAYDRALNELRVAQVNVEHEFTVTRDRLIHARQEAIHEARKNSSLVDDIRAAAPSPWDRGDRPSGRPHLGFRPNRAMTSSVQAKTAKSLYRFPFGTPL